MCAHCHAPCCGLKRPLPQRLLRVINLPVRMASDSGTPGAALLSPARRQSYLKRLSDLNPFRSPGAESAGSVEVDAPQPPPTCVVSPLCHWRRLLTFFTRAPPSSPSLQDEDAEYEQLKKDVVANTRRLVLEPFIIAAAAAVGLNFGAAMRCVARVCTGRRHVFYSRRSQAVGRCNVYFPIGKEVKFGVFQVVACLHSLAFICLGYLHWIP